MITLRDHLGIESFHYFVYYHIDPHLYLVLAMFSLVTWIHSVFFCGHDLVSCLCMDLQFIVLCAYA
jgi:hypothetical protein